MGKTRFTYNVETGEFFDTTSSGFGSEHCTKPDGGSVRTQYLKPKAAVIAGGFTPCEGGTYTPPRSPSTAQTFGTPDGGSYTVTHLGKNVEQGDYTIILQACTPDAPYEACTAENLSELAAELEVFKTGYRVELVGVDPAVAAADHRRTDPIVTIFDNAGDIVSFSINIAQNGDIVVDTKTDVTGLGFVAVVR